jgi:ADP-ribose pyrophosphatase YjhB (NUDIX family)
MGRPRARDSPHRRGRLLGEARLERFMKVTNVATATAILRPNLDRRVILACRSKTDPGKLTLPGGTIRFDGSGVMEEPLEVVLREVEEKTGASTYALERFGICQDAEREVRHVPFRDVAGIAWGTWRVPEDQVSDETDLVEVHYRSPDFVYIGRCHGIDRKGLARDELVLYDLRRFNPDEFEAGESTLLQWYQWSLMGCLPWVRRREIPVNALLDLEEDQRLLMRELAI